MSEYVDGFGRTLSFKELGNKSPVDPRSTIGRKIAKQGGPVDLSDQGQQRSPAEPGNQSPGWSTVPVERRTTLKKVMPVVIGLGALGGLLLILKRARKRR